MLEKFMSLDEEKRMRIINAAMREFARKGFKNAKTDKIVQEAGISKGLLFHYFGTKKRLYMFLLDYALDFMEKEFMPQISMDKDIFQRLLQNALLKVKLYRKYADLIDFYASAHFKGIGAVKEEVDARRNAFYRKAQAAALEGLDLSRFRDDVDPRVAIEIISWTVDGFGNKILASYRDKPVEDIDFAGFVKEFDRYMLVLKNSFYKQGV